MFEDILSPRELLTDEDVSRYDEYGYYKDDQQKNITLANRRHDESCNCDDCLEEAIKILADRLNVDLTDEAIEEIKKEYLDKHTDPSMANYTTREGKLAICVLRAFHRLGTNNCLRRFKTDEKSRDL